MTQTFDAIVIGGGIMGCSTAYQLAERGLATALLEKDLIGAGGSGKSSAIIRQHYSNELTARMALYSLRTFQNFDEIVGGECGFTETGFAAVASASDQEGLEANVALQRSVGIQTEILAPEALRNLVPGIEISDLVSAAYEPESGYADPYLTVQAYAQAARRKEARIFQDHEVVGFRFKGEKVVGVDTFKGQFEAPLVINCTGAWSASVSMLADVEVPIDSCRVQVAFLRRPAGYEAPHPVFVDFINAIYFRSEIGQLTLVGLIDPAEANAVVDPDNFNENLDSDFVLYAGERLIRRYPPLERSQSTGGYASLYAITPDWHPVIDELLPGSGLYICAGFSGHGFKLGPAVGLMTADLVTGEENPEFDCHLFRSARFAEEDPVRGQYAYSIAG